MTHSVPSNPSSSPAVGHASASTQSVDIDMDWCFEAIAQLLPLEACLHHRVLPLSQVDRYLYLGAVDPEDATGLEYVRRILAHTGYEVVVQAISGDVHQHMLSAYLSYDRQCQQGEIVPTTTIYPPGDAVDHAGMADRAGMGDLEPTVTVGPDLDPALVVDRSEQSAVAPGEIPKGRDAQNQDAQNQDAQEHEFQERDALTPEMHQREVRRSPEDVVWNTNLPGTDMGPETMAATEAFQREFEQALEASLAADSQGYPISIRDHLPQLQAESKEARVPRLVVRSQYPDRPLDTLGQLGADDLLGELLQRALSQGIGRLFWSHHEGECRILWSVDGVLQSVLETVSAETFQGSIDALRRLAGLVAMQDDQPQQVEIERMYEGEVLLLRLRIFRDHDAEEATLQVLRGAALRFYRQQQMTRLSQDALKLARQLQTKVDELHRQARHASGLATERLPLLPELSDLLQRLRDELNDLE